MSEKVICYPMDKNILAGAIRTPGDVGSRQLKRKRNSPRARRIRGTLAQPRHGAQSSRLPAAASFLLTPAVMKN